MNIINDNCDHIKTKSICDGKKECIDCGKVFCMHPKMDHDSTCMMCGEYVVDVSSEQTWMESSYNNANTTIKNTKHHIKKLEEIGYPPEIIEATMDKFSKIGCSLSEEPAVLAVCVWMTFWDLDNPRTMIEIAKKHSLTKSSIKKGRQIVLSLAIFDAYRTKYITVTMMVNKLLNDLKIDRKYHAHIFSMAKFVEDNWDKSMHTRRCAPQNVAAACVFLYISFSPSLSHFINTPTKKKQICSIMGPSNITIDKIVKQLEEFFINTPIVKSSKKVVIFKKATKKKVVV